MDRKVRRCLHSHPLPGKVLNHQVSVGADDAVSDELLLERSDAVSLQHIQPVQQLWRTSMTEYGNDKVFVSGCF